MAAFKKQPLIIILIISLNFTFSPAAVFASPDAGGSPYFEPGRGPTRYEAIVILVRLLGKSIYEMLTDTGALTETGAADEWVTDAQMPESGPGASSDNAYAFERKVFELTNRERRKNGLENLIWDDRLAAAARKHSEDLAKNDFTGHTGSDGADFVDRITREGVTAYTYCENVCYGYNTPEEAIEGWMGSTGHMDNILKAGLTHMGVGFYEYPDSYYGIYVTQDFVGMN